ncbi:hypothetical protein OESDEN_00812 [Oesophagostomum dentatum]|uniref:Methyltransferase domain-containing protein n=1 Tax=Oesophagostomum dentatum TaxID=61180 RepID=A0A0B1TPP3_OESDE|nr:hypothetical protein OESDEN_00812 [Oesophagostomum dentatum]
MRLFHMLCDALLRFWFFIFDRLILYPALCYLSPVLGIQFLNLGYWPTDDSTKEEAQMKQIVEQCSSETDPDRPHYYLYERALLVHPKYPALEGLQLLEVGCGQGNGLKWLKKAHPEIKSLLGIDRCALKGTCTVPGDAHHLPCGDQQFDIEYTHMRTQMG